ncbi:MAG: chitobiase/beta-hexosaminidase C-terminal domain-containing protein [Bacteroidaceae bacterium]|nr:chitobiase/beta-hexosaminidase C-terminal domain-containing protein [Bacteroidaceae bacterium]
MIQINAKQQKLKFDKESEGRYMYVMHVNQYSKLSANKVLDEANSHSGIGKGSLKGAWDAIGEVVRSWVTEGHSVTIPGLGTIRFSVQAKAVEDVEDVAKKLITNRKVVFTPDPEILAALKATGVQITCIDKDGKVVKRVQDDASNETIVVEDPDSQNGQQNGEGSLASPVISGVTPFEESTEVTITGPVEAEIRYTTDGSTPTAESTLYEQAITLSNTATVKAIAIKDGLSSEVASKLFTKGNGGGGNDNEEPIED